MKRFLAVMKRFLVVIGYAWALITIPVIIMTAVTTPFSDSQDDTCINTSKPKIVIQYLLKKISTPGNYIGCIIAKVGFKIGKLLTYPIK